MRILGVYFIQNEGDSYNISLLKNKIAHFSRSFNSKKINISQLVYISNTVLIPRLEYRCKTTILEDARYEKLFSPVYKAAKHKLGLSSKTHNNIITHPGLVNLTSLWKNQLAAHITEFFVLINTHLRALDTTLIRLRQAQLDLNLTNCIF